MAEHGSTGWLTVELEQNASAWPGDAGLAARMVVLRDGQERRALAGAVPLALALLLELDAREGEYVLFEALRHVLTDGTADDRAEAARLLALLRDKPSEQALIDLALAGGAEEGVLSDVAEWASSAGRERIRAWLAADGTDFEMRTLAALGGLPRALAERFGEIVAEQLRNAAERADEVAALLRDGDAIGALLLHGDVNVHEEIEGLGRIDDPRIRPQLRAWLERREDGRAHWALGELALAGDSSARSQIENVVQVGCYRWVDDASADVLLLGAAELTWGSVGFWAHEAESNCCRAVAVKRVFEDAVGLNVTSEMNFQPGTLVALAEWLRWRLSSVRWLMTDPLGRVNWPQGAPSSIRALAWSDIEDGYVPSVR